MSSHHVPDGGPAGYVVVGYHGTTASEAALMWAAREAADTGAQLRVVVAWEPEARDRRREQRRDDLASPVGLARIGAAMASRLLPGRGRVLPQVVLGSPSVVLLEQAQPATILVLGSRGRVGGPDTRLGAVGQGCVRGASVPVVLISPDALTTPERRIVLTATDGDVSGPATPWALSRAIRNRRSLHVIDACGRLDEPGAFSERANGALARHRTAMIRLGTALSGRALLSGELVRRRFGGLNLLSIRNGDLVVANADDHLPEDRLGPSRYAVASIPRQVGAERTASESRQVPSRPREWAYEPRGLPSM